ncbi:hypothetical protein KIH74_14135 [Kineosporia sp. J2-2]|uniref:Acyl-CoA dehydrogenase C-terminal domain-containing protein n=1 Tax=Kineosporia corallincola TaxID=2835133 RepID=A0ABS5TG61_9ACTN|nr:hypothetical protein [Kineosporia corallincola]MBT0770074.1 hypothetical protein [Kineosporia corallincola]
MSTTEFKILAANAAVTEEQGRPAAASLEAVRAAGDFALRTPVEHGGAWAGAVAVSRRLASLAQACPSTAWNVGTSAVAKTLAARSGLDAALFADPLAQACGTGVPTGQLERGPHGARLNGSWVSVSGCEDAEWALLGVMDGAVFSVAAVPLADLRVEHTWDMAGMRGTGSHTLVARDVPVPDHRIAAAKLPGEYADLLFYGLTALAPVVGATQGALGVVREMFASDRKPFMSAHAKMGESAGARHWLARATALTGRAERTMLALAAEAEAGATDAPRLGLELAEASRDCRAALELLLDLGGTRGFRRSNDLQRFWRDVAVAGRHPHLNAYLATERYGEALTAGL